MKICIILSNINDNVESSWRGACSVFYYIPPLSHVRMHFRVVFNRYTVSYGFTYVSLLPSKSMYMVSSFYYNASGGFYLVLFWLGPFRPFESGYMHSTTLGGSPLYFHLLIIFFDLTIWFLREFHASYIAALKCIPLVSYILYCSLIFKLFYNFSFFSGGLFLLILELTKFFSVVISPLMRATTEFFF